MFNKSIKNDNRGFSMVELIVVICIMTTLGVVLALSMSGHVEKAKEAKTTYNAKNLFDAAQAGIVSASINTPEAFGYAIKYEETIDGETVRLGRFSSQSLYKYMKESAGAGSLSSAKSKAADYHIAQQLVETLPNVSGDIEGDYLKDKSPIGDSNSIAYIAEHPEIYGNVVFAMAYTSSGDILYFQCVYDGYFYTYDGSTFEGQKVTDSLKFNDWPKTRFEQSKKENW